MIPAFHDEQWAEFRRTCEEAGILPGGETDWLWAAHSWSQLDMDQRTKALKDVQERSLEDYTISRALPQNYLKGRYWTRTHTRRKRVRIDPAAVERHNAALVREQEQARKREEELIGAFDTWWAGRSPEEQRALFTQEKRALLARCPSLKFNSDPQVQDLVMVCIREMRKKMLEVAR